MPKRIHMHGDTFATVFVSLHDIKENIHVQEEETQLDYSRGTRAYRI